MTFEQSKRLIIVMLLAIVLAVILAGPNMKKDTAEPVVEVVATTTDMVPDEELSKPEPLTCLVDVFRKDERLAELEAKAVYVEWLNEGLVLYDKNAYTPMPLASLTKIMTAYTALEKADPETTQITFTLDALRQPGDQGFRDGQTMPLGLAINFALAVSSNDAAYAIQENLSGSEVLADGTLLSGNRDVAINSFVRDMNKHAEDFELEDTFFVDAVGFDSSERLSGSYGSARDVAKLIIEAAQAYPHYIGRQSVVEKMGAGDRMIPNTNQLITQEDFLFSKTGFTDLAGGNLAVIANTEAGPVAIVVMGSTYEGRFRDVEVLIRMFEDWSGNLPDND